MITPDEAAALCRVSTRAVYRWLETGAIHFSEAVGEGLLICEFTGGDKYFTERPPF